MSLLRLIFMAGLVATVVWLMYLGWITRHDG